MEPITPHPAAFACSHSLPNPLGRPTALRHAASAAAVVAALGVAIFAGTQIGGSSANGNTLASQSNAPLSARVLDPHALPGFALSADSAPVPSASDWARVERTRRPDRETARLRSLGFLGGYDEQLRARYPSPATAVSVVERYQTPSGARGELAFQYAQLRRQAEGSGSTFSVPTIPDARGLRTQAAGRVEMTVLFASGSYFYAIHTGFRDRTPGVPSPAQLSSAAGTLNLTVNGCIAARHQTA
jgi:hypothetical protein